MERERKRCWLMVAIAALAAWPLAIGLAFLLYEQEIAALLGGLVGPLLVVFIARYSFRWQYSRAACDLVYGSMALMLMDEEYGRVVEQAAHERYRPSPQPVYFGNDLASRLDHLAHYYAQYYRMSRGPARLAMPYALQLNCWSEGCLLALGGGAPLLDCAINIALPTTMPFAFWPELFCFGPLLVVPLILRVVLLWPSILGTKQAVVDYFGGVYDYLLEPQPAPPPAGPAPR